MSFLLYTGKCGRLYEDGGGRCVYEILRGRQGARVQDGLFFSEKKHDLQFDEKREIVLIV